ncbi:YybH family protein [Flagellimonas allohymeniacidonis]|uniref:Nuclear transport factor 2 family protein n=1 Tax=Flagellimonas allohymeniacidonis TaxID=2517819 RepID=A0A4Q8QK70_9FLAO|nr:nuclear transport factor 2 family protein [Allomuricauda hymeniacidonis]TAI48909.1 nuclear transport factor 2 family protein [Allomuricauda hymeniacidonis]
MKQLFTFTLVLFCSISFGQRQKTEVPEALLEAIKTDVWTPFMEAYDELDPQKLKSFHSDDIIRISINQNDIRSGQTYLESFGGFLVGVKERGAKVRIAFAILSTAIDSSGEMAYQTGYYRFSSKRAGESDFVHRGYGYFNVGLKKVDGQWKIWLDSDKRADITDEDFANHELVYEL